MENLEIYGADRRQPLALPLADEGVRAGFPSPAQGYMEQTIDLNRELVLHPESTFYARVAGDSMVDADLCEGDLLIVDRSLTPRDGCVAVCVLDGEFTVKTLRLFQDHVELHPANDAYPPILVGPTDHFKVWGVVTHVIKRLLRRR